MRFATTVAKRLFAVRPDRMLSGTNWRRPHSHPPPDEGDLVDWIAAVTASAAGLRRVLVDNPAGGRTALRRPELAGADIQRS